MLRCHLIYSLFCYEDTQVAFTTKFHSEMESDVLFHRLKYGKLFRFLPFYMYWLSVLSESIKMVLLIL